MHTTKRFVTNHLIISMQFLFTTHHQDLTAQLLYLPPVEKTFDFHILRA